MSGLTGAKDSPNGQERVRPETRERGSAAPRTVAFLLYDELEELDFVGPLEVFGVAGRLRSGTFRILTVAQSIREIRGRYGLKLMPEYGFEDCPAFDLLVVPGGPGALEESRNPEVLSFVRQAAHKREYVCSVCTGALILAAAGLLDGRTATTHWAALDELRAFPKVTVDHRRFILDGNVMTSAGISAGIDMALHAVEMLYGRELSAEVALRMEYVTGYPDVGRAEERRAPREHVENPEV